MCCLPKDTTKKEPDVDGWIIGNGKGDQWRFIDYEVPSWTDDPLKAIRFARREDAEEFARGDEDAWTIVLLSAVLLMNNLVATKKEPLTGVELIAAERQRQVEVEGWTPEHDDEHRSGELGMAAQAYIDGSRKAVHATSDLWKLGAPTVWPWETSWWKPSDDPIRNLVKAGALIAAEIDRLQRKKL